MSGEEHSGLSSDKFKNIGIDANFIKENANEYNDKISGLYHGGKKDENMTVEEIMQQPETKQVEPAQQQEIPSVSPQETAQQSQPVLQKEHVEQIATAKMTELAHKMQAYADETDKRIAQLESRIKELQQQAPEQQKLVVEKGEKPKHERAQSNTDEMPAEADVSIEKMFDFSNNRTGQLRR